MNKIACPYCSSSNCKIEYRLQWPDERFANYQVARCKECDLGFVLPLPTPAELDELYNSLEYQSGDRSTTDFSKASQSVIDAAIEKEQNFLPKYAHHLPTSGHVLDIGSGWGTLLKQFANQGYQTTGLELSEPTSEFAKNVLGLNIHNKPTEWISELPDPTYDLIIMRHVLEHLYEPAEVLGSIHSKMDEQSKLIIEVPDYGSYDRWIYGDSWPGFGPYHLWYFSRRSLGRVLEDAGFEVLSYNTFMSKWVLDGSSRLQKFGRKIINRLGGRFVFSGRSIGLIARKRSERSHAKQ